MVAGSPRLKFRRPRGGTSTPGIVGAGQRGPVVEKSSGVTETAQRVFAWVERFLKRGGLLWGVGIDRLVWHVLPSARVCLGGGIVIASGLYLIWRERGAAHAAPQESWQ